MSRSDRISSISMYTMRWFGQISIIPWAPGPNICRDIANLFFVCQHVLLEPSPIPLPAPAFCSEIISHPRWWVNLLTLMGVSCHTKQSCTEKQPLKWAEPPKLRRSRAFLASAQGTLQQCWMKPVWTLRSIYAYSTGSTKLKISFRGRDYLLNVIFFYLNGFKIAYYS